MSARVNQEGFRRFRRKLDLLRIDYWDLKGPILVEMGQVHRRQQAQIFTSEGRAGAGGKFSPLNPSYAARKKKAVGRKKILQLTGDMKSRFTKRSNPNYVQEYVAGAGSARGVMRFGAYSDVAAAHRAGNPSLANPTSRSHAAKTLFGGIAKRLRVRDMMSKTPQQIHELLRAAKDWYINKRIPQATRHVR